MTWWTLETFSTTPPRSVDLFLPTTTALIKSSLRSQFGTWVDAVNFQTGDATVTQQGNAAADLFRGAGESVMAGRFTGDLALRENLYFSIGLGACAIRDLFSGGTPTGGYANTLSSKLVYRFPQGLSVQAGREPQSNAMNCLDKNTVRGVVPTPSQWGLSLSRSWRF